MKSINDVEYVFYTVRPRYENTLLILPRVFFGEKKGVATFLTEILNFR